MTSISTFLDPFQTPQSCFGFLRTVVDFLRREAPLDEPVVLQKKKAGKQITPNNTYRGQLLLTPDASQQGRAFHRRVQKILTSSNLRA